jgi:CheY-like chemotaxis protein
MGIVLIVEDDPINMKVFAKILTKRAGLEVKGTEDVEEVITTAQSGVVDVILMDVSLANSYYQGQPVDGTKITQLLKNDDATKEIPIILVTAHAMRGDREDLLAQSGADAYISKPIVDHEDFINTIKKMIKTNC